MKRNYKKLLAAVLTIAAAVAGHTSAWAQGISVTSSTSGTTTTFTITRSGSVLPAQTVNYRTVALSTFPGQNFNAVSGTLNFAANETSKTVTVTEKTPAASSKFGYSAGATSGYRNYRFEVLDLNGFLLAYRERNWQVTGVITRAASGTWDLDDTRTGTFYSQSSGPIMITDDGYDSNPWDSFKPFDTQKYLSLPSTTFYEDGTRAYLYANGTQLRMTLEFRAYEFDDGYQYLQVLTDNTSTCDNRSGCSNGDPGNISLSRYMAGFEMDKGDVYTTYKTYTFPVLSVGSGVGHSDPWGYGDQFPLSKQKFRSSCRATDGKIILNTNFNTLVLRLNASGSGDDDWAVNDIKAYVNAVDETAPYAVTNDITVSAGPYNKGNDFYISVPFSEIVIGGGTLSTSWGDATYFDGSGTNVLTFKGTITAGAGTELSVTGFTGNAPKDLFQNAMTGTISKTFTGVTSTETYTFDVFQSPESNVYDISSRSDLASLAALVNRVGNDCSGKTFRQTQDITCGYDYTPIGYYVSTSDKAWFRGTYDGQGHTVSGVNISRMGDSLADGYMGLFGYIGNGGLVKNVVLAGSTFTGWHFIGGIVGFLESGTVQNCRVESTVTITAGAKGASYHGGIAGYSTGNIRGCISAAAVSRNSKSNCTEYGGIAGRNASISTVKDCLYTGTSVDAYSLKGAIVGYKEGGTLTNNYYTAINLGGVNSSDQDGARRARTVSLGTGVTLSGSETTYDVSGLTAIGTTALSYTPLPSGGGGGRLTIYSGEGQTLTLVYTGTPSEGYLLSGFSVKDADGNDIAVTQDDGIYTFTMPTSNVSVTALFALDVIVGDVNDDRQVTVDDVPALVALILSGSTDYSLSVVDVNSDGQLSLADVTALVNIVLNK